MANKTRKPVYVSTEGAFAGSMSHNAPPTGAYTTIQPAPEGYDEEVAAYDKQGKQELRSGMANAKIERSGKRQ